MRREVAVIAVGLTLASCRAVLGFDDYTLVDDPAPGGGSGGAGGGVGAGGIGGSGGQEECAEPVDCDDDNVCTDEDCTNHVCGYTPVAAETPCNQLGGIMCNGDAVDPSCVECVNNDHCDGATPICDLASWACTSCGNGTCNSNETASACAADCGVVAVSAGGAHTCAVLADGTARCWGSNDSSQLGNGNRAVGSNVPVTVSGLVEASAVAAGSAHTCAIAASGAVKCWGANANGQLGDDTNDQGDVPVDVVSLGGAAEAITAGGTHSCARLSNSSARCWGSDSHGELGSNAGGPSNVPIFVDSITTAATIDVGANHSCATVGDQTAHCWGSDGDGQLGNGTPLSDSQIAVPVLNLTNLLDISAGAVHTCARTGLGALHCWGANGSGQLGDASNTPSPIPVAVTGVASATAVSAGGAHTCAVIDGGTVMCWGSNGSGLLGNGSLGGTNSSPAAVTGLDGVQAVAAGSEHTCALLVDGTLRCWGANVAGQLGNGTFTPQGDPVQVSGL